MCSCLFFEGPSFLIVWLKHLIRSFGRTWQITNLVGLQLAEVLIPYHLGVWGAGKNPAVEETDTRFETESDAMELCDLAEVGVG